jgi:hypothetical protein
MLLHLQSWNTVVAKVRTYVRIRTSSWRIFWLLYQPGCADYFDSTRSSSRSRQAMLFTIIMPTQINLLWKDPVMLPRGIGPLQFKGELQANGEPFLYMNLCRLEINTVLNCIGNSPKSEGNWGREVASSVYGAGCTIYGSMRDARFYSCCRRTSRNCGLDGWWAPNLIWCCTGC